LGSEDNYRWDEANLELSLFMKILGVDYVRENTYKIKLELVTLNEKELI
jgi:hypothetical protein